MIPTTNTTVCPILAFSSCSETETTKHVHRIHPYKGKFIPQLVEYFLDTHTDNIKKEVFFKKGDIVLDPFCGSGTTLVQANELGINSLGIDVSSFNTLIANAKVRTYNTETLRKHIHAITRVLKEHTARTNINAFEKEIQGALKEFNKQYFSPSVIKKMSKNVLKTYCREKEEEFRQIYRDIVEKYGIELNNNTGNTFFETWYGENIKTEILLARNALQEIQDPLYRNILSVVLSRSMRSGRATKHSDLATLKEPIFMPYYCRKHRKICKPIFSIEKRWNTYAEDTLKRIEAFQAVCTNTFQECLQGDSRTIDIVACLETINIPFAKMVKEHKIQGIFSSPPYVGLIDYHQQHAYAYDVFGYTRNDEQEIGALSEGTSNKAKEAYVSGIADVLLNIMPYLAEDYTIFLVADDTYGLYPKIAQKAGLEIVERWVRPVLRRSEGDKGEYFETIFMLKGQKSTKAIY